MNLRWWPLLAVYASEFRGALFVIIVGGRAQRVCKLASSKLVAARGMPIWHPWRRDRNQHYATPE